MKTSKTRAKKTTKEHPVAAALRVELQALIDRGPMTAKSVKKVETLARCAFRVLLEVEPDAKSVGTMLRRHVHGLYGPINGSNSSNNANDDDDDDDDAPMASSGPAETFGVRAICEMVASATQALRPQPRQEGALELTMAIADARRLGMPDVAAELEQRLLGKSLPGERPVHGLLPVTNGHAPGGAS